MDFHFINTDDDVRTQISEIKFKSKLFKSFKYECKIIYPSCTRPPMKGPDMKVARKWHVQVKMSNGDIFVCGGKNDEDEYLDSCEILSAASNEFRLLNCKMNVGRIACGGVAKGIFGSHGE